MQHAIETLLEGTGSALANELEMICRIKTNERLSVMIHELAQPLQIIRMLAEQLTKRPDVPSQAMERILAQANGMATILEQVGTIAPVLNLQPTFINPLIRESLELVYMAKRPHSVQTKLELDGDVMLTIDKHQITQVLTNLIRNAIEAMQTSGQHLLIKTMHVATGIEIAVIDDGPGIDPSIVDHLFKPFVTSKPSGAGIGLAVSLGIIKAHHGTLSLRMDSDNTTCFVIYLPTG